MKMVATGEVTKLLAALSAGDRSALDRLMPIVYERLRAIAHGQLRHERSDHTLTTTALVHEVYLQLSDGKPLQTSDRSHFFAICARAMRRILVNYAERKNAQKRGGGKPPVPLEGALAVADSRSDDILAVDDALRRLEESNERRCRIVEYRFFGGLTIEETAEALSISPATVKREWTVARAWLNRELEA